MANGPSRTADELTTAIRSLIDRALESQTRDEVAARGRELAKAIADNTGSAATRASVAANDAWRDSAPQRRQAIKQARRMSKDAWSWSRKRWSRQVRPALKDAWDKRAVAALGAAGIAVPASGEIVDRTRKRLGLREEHRWRTFFLGVIVGAIAGAVVALLTAPRPGREVRDELTSRARDAATNAPDWVPLFQREPATRAAIENNPALTEASGEALPEGGTRRQRASRQASETTEAINGAGNGADPVITPAPIETTEEPSPEI
jgi:gas vesicle protein